MKKILFLALSIGFITGCGSKNDTTANETSTDDIQTIDTTPVDTTPVDTDTQEVVPLDTEIHPYDTEIVSDWDTYEAKGDGLALTPPMGWNSWNHFKQAINERLIQDIADAMVSSGMKDVGYEYINLDDQWMSADGRDTDGSLLPHPTRFPNGIKAVADYVHERGLKLGIYGNRGTMTCSNVTESGSFEHEAQDAQTWADWGVDYVKYDNCNLPDGHDDPEVLRADYELMATSLEATERPIVFSLCAWGWYGEWMINTGHLWRSTGDISDCWSNADDCHWRKEWENGIVDIIDQNANTAQYAGPGHWNDPDMLEVGNGRLSAIEYTSHFSLWSIMAAPLIAGNDLRNMDESTISILTNAEVIAVDQDPAGIQGTRVRDHGDLEIWMKPLHKQDGDMKAVALFNRSAVAAEITADFSDVGLTGTAFIRDLWAHQDLGKFTDSFTATVESHGVVMVKMIQQ